MATRHSGARTRSGSHPASHCHGLPTYQFVSVVDMVRVLIENFPDDFPGGGPSTDDHGDHGGHGTHSAGGS